MFLDTKEQVDQFLVLQQKNEIELKIICQKLDIRSLGNKKELINEILKSNVITKVQPLVSQAIPLRSRDTNSQPMPDAIQAMKEWRKVIFNNAFSKDFSLINNNGDSYVLKMKYTTCKPKTLNTICNQKWYIPLKRYDNILNQVNKNLNLFTINIIQKPSQNNSNWLMLHISPINIKKCI